MAGVGRIGKEARRFIRESPELSGLARITGEMAVSVADLADTARLDGKPREALAALAALRDLLAELAPKAAPGESGAGVGGAAAGGVRGPADELESVLGSGPVVGDRAHS